MLFAAGRQEAWIGVIVVVQNVVSSLFNSHLFDFHEGWMYVLGVGVAGGLALRTNARTHGSVRADQATSAVSSTSPPTGARRDSSSRNFSKGRGGATR